MMADSELTYATPCMCKAEFAYLSPTMQHLASAREPEDDLLIQEPNECSGHQLKERSSVSPLG